MNEQEIVYILGFLLLPERCVLTAGGDWVASIFKDLQGIWAAAGGFFSTRLQKHLTHTYSEGRIFTS